MMKTATVNTRIDPELKSEAEHILHEIGLSSAEAIRLFYKQICLQHGLPFDVKIPNRTTLKAMRDSDERRTHKVESIEELFEDI